jgi:hypothetical protein
MISDQIYNFMEQANERSESVLIHSVRGQSRAASVIAVYLMRKYKWTLLKTLEFLNSRRPDLEMRTTFIQQLTDHEQRLAARGMGAQSSKWVEIAPSNKFLESEELLLRNTYVNAQPMEQQITQFRSVSGYRPPSQTQSKLKSKHKPRLKWVDIESCGRKNLAVENRDELDLVNLRNPSKVTSHLVRSSHTL